jgi:hypothetical protein
MILKYRAEDGSLVAGNRFLDYFWGFHIARRATEVVDNHKGDWDYYILFLWEYLNVLWFAAVCFAVPWALWRVARWAIEGSRRRRMPGNGNAGSNDDERRPPWTLDHSLAVLAAWLVFVAGASVASTSKREVYSLPFMPAMALMCGAFLTRYWRGGLPRWGERVFTAVTVVLLVAWRSRNPVRLAGKWLEQDISAWEKSVHIADVLWTVALGGLAVAAALEIVARLGPSGRRFGRVVALGALVYAGYIAGLSHCFDLKSMRDYHWEVVEAAIRRGDYDSVAFVGFSDEPDIFYYTDGICAGWKHEIEFRFVTPGTNPEANPIPPDKDRLVVFQKNYPAFVGWGDEQTKRILKYYEMTEEGRDFAIYRATHPRQGAVRA